MADTSMTLKLSADIDELLAGLAKAQDGLKDFQTAFATLRQGAAIPVPRLDSGAGDTDKKSAQAAAKEQRKAEQLAKQAQRQAESIDAALASAAKPKSQPAPSSDTPGFLAIFGLDDPQTKVDEAMTKASAAFEAQRAKLQRSFEAAHGTGDLDSLARQAVATNESGAAIQQKFAGESGADPAVLTRSFEQMVKLQSAFTAQSQRISAQGAASWRKDWESAMQPIDSAFVSATNGMITGTESLGQAARKGAQSIVLSYVDASEKMALKWVTDRMVELTQSTAVETAKTTATTAGTAARTAVQTAGATAGKAAQNSADSASIMSSAKTAAAGAFSAVSSIPIVGPILAPAAAAAAFAGVMAFDVLSAEGGLTRVPFDGMPAILHENETVMPAHVANPMRDFFTDYQGQVAGGQGGGDTHVHVNYAPAVGGRLSRTEFEGALRDHAGVLARHLGNAARNAAPGARA